MARLYVDENFPMPVIGLLRAFGHDILTAQQAGNANLGIPDEEVLAFAANADRAVLTNNRQDYIRLHRSQPNHAGIVVCTEDLNFEQLASRIHEAIATQPLTGKLIRVNRPSS